MPQVGSISPTYGRWKVGQHSLGATDKSCGPLGGPLWNWQSPKGNVTLFCLLEP